MDQAADTIYVAWHDGIAVIDGATDDVTYPSSIFAMGTGIDDSMAIDHATSDLYLVNFINDAQLQVIDTATDETTTPVDVGEDPVAVAVNQKANTIYVANCASGYFDGVWVIDAANEATDAEISDGCPAAITTDPANNTAYVIDGDSGALSVISGSSYEVVAHIGVGEEPSAVAVDPDTGTVYVADRTVSGNVTAVTPAAPVITSAGGVTFAVGKRGSFTATATGVPRPAFSEVGRLPRGVKLSPGGLLSGTPVSGAGGRYQITLTASNGIGAAGIQQFWLTVDQGPSVTSRSLAVFKAGRKDLFTITSAGFPLATITEVGKLPKGVTFREHRNGTASLSGTPALSTARHSYVLRLTAKNGAGRPVTQLFTLRIT